MVALSFNYQAYQQRDALRPAMSLLVRPSVNERSHECTTGDVEESREFGRGERIRTSGLYVPNVALYQAKLHPDR